ncbi:MAG: RNA methyltransferase [Verrucomicrobiae bacterium]|nr:RNA methyltransferase [Verrucomicrobiae bacterium]
MTSESTGPLPEEVRDRLGRGETDERFLVEGRHAVMAALESEFVVEAVVATRSDDAVGAAARGQSVPVSVMSPVAAATLLGFGFHRGVLAIARQSDRDLSVWATETEPLRLVFLEKLADPGNVGTVIRNAAAFGFDGVILSGGGASPFNAKAVRASATAIFRVPVFFVSDLAEAKRWLPKVVWIGTDLSADSEPLEAFPVDRDDPLGIVLGSEADGLTSTTLSLCDRVVRIAISDRVESLNVASASAILLHAFGEA